MVSLRAFPLTVSTSGKLSDALDVESCIDGSLLAMEEDTALFRRHQKSIYFIGHVLAENLLDLLAKRLV